MINSETANLTGSQLVEWIDSEYNGVDHRLIGNYYARLSFDNMLNIVLVMILLNMIQGIIVDTFGSLRE